MKRKLYISAISTLVLLNIACTKNDHLTPLERKAVGQYSFEKVVIHKDGFKTENITQQYHNMILQLNDKREAALIDRNNNITYLGKYDIVVQNGTTMTDDDGNTTTNSNNTIIIDIKGGGRGGDYHWVGEDASFGNKLRFNTQKADGRYAYKLDKI